MEDINYIDEKIANDTANMVTFNLNTPKFANFLNSFANVLTYKYRHKNDAKAIAHNIIRLTCKSKRMSFNFNTNYAAANNGCYSIYLNYDGKLVVYLPESSRYGIRHNKTNEDSIKLVANTIKQLSLSKFNYDLVVEFTNTALAEIDAEVEDMRSKNNGKLVVKAGNDAVFSRQLVINNAVIEFVVCYENYSILNERYNGSSYKYAFLTVKYNPKNDVQESGVVTAYPIFKYNLGLKCYDLDLSNVLSKLDFGDHFKNEWNAKNTRPSVFDGFTVGEVYNIYCLIANKKNAVKQMSDEVKKEYISNDKGLNPIESEVIKQLQREMTDIKDATVKEMKDLHQGLLKKLVDTKNKIQEEIVATNNRVVEKYKDEIRKRNKILAESNSNFKLSEEVPEQLLDQNGISILYSAF